jgi:hypothetical protein
LDKVSNQVNKFYGDGAYDPWKVREALEQQGIAQMIPSRKDAKIKRHGSSKRPPLPHDEAIRGIRKYGRKGWKRRTCPPQAGQLPPPRAGGNRDVPHENQLRWPIEKPTHRKPKSRSKN